MNKVFYRESGRALWWTIVVILLLVVLTVVSVFAFGWGQRLTASFRGETAEREMTQADGRFRLATYEDFYQLCTAAQNSEAQIKSLEEELETDPPESRVTQINSSLTAVRASRASSINEYNSKAGQEHREAFHSNSLPERLSINDGETKCDT